MKTLVVAAALAAVAASPALAASRGARTASSAYDAAYGAGYDANAAAYGTPGAFGNSPAVIFNNRVVGQDPDPNVRLMLEKDPGLQDY